MRVFYSFFVCGLLYTLLYVSLYHWWSDIGYHQNFVSRSVPQTIVEKTPVRRNVLMIVADDLRPQLDVYHDLGLSRQIYDRMVTPNLHDLARESLVVKNAFAQYSVCSPSRASTLTSRRPKTTRVYDLETYWRKSGGDFTTLPQYFKENGYLTQGIGKVFHHGEASGFNNDDASWTHPFFQANARYWKGKEKSWRAVSYTDRRRHPLMDDKVLTESQNALKTLSKEAKMNDTNFFLAVGFYKPHLPWIFPEEFLYQYPKSDIDVAINRFAPRNVPPIAGSHYQELVKYTDIKLYDTHLSGDYNDTIPIELSKDLRRAYYACVSYIDHQIGQLLGTLGALGLENDTIIAFWGDHGFILGEYGTWCKHSMFELAARVPLLLRVPGQTDRGVTTNHLVELVDLFPTLVDVAGLPPIPPCPEYSRNVTLCTEGSSFASLVHQPQSSIWKTRVFMEQMREREDGMVFGRSVRTKFFRYTEWNSTENNVPHGKELYNINKDPLQFENLAGSVSYEKVEAVLQTLLHKGWAEARNSLQ
ncbi:hypothetical protein CAPTEDRAFT_134558 [Capitella teleta]|uniref:Sulfatase N-terminal domain-containing protein n=1 Tax=Capitella teleta TaxID=283909 RepID=R7TJD3_CAPTE|nr:hypothetical protein CAPTEDRAFT_134558 [Capitella teleta]|eukprot:ELT93612.1 hypothetical protein CAPTEDRAFT_134558 [Capitella teleta]